MPDKTGKHYLIRDIPLDLWRRVKDKAEIEDRRIRNVILRLLEAWAGKDKP